MRRRNIAAAAGLIVCGLVYGFLSLGLPERSLPNTPGPSFFPLVVAAMLIALSTVMLVRALAEEDGTPASPGDAAPGMKRQGPAIVVLATFLVYIVLLPILGFVVATVPFFAVLMVLFGERRPLVVVVAAVTMTAVLYGLFRHGFGVFLPRGILAGIVP